MGLQHTKFMIHLYNTTTMESGSIVKRVMIRHTEKATKKYLSWSYIYKKYPHWDIGHQIIVEYGFVGQPLPALHMLGDPDSETYYVICHTNTTNETITFKVFEAETGTREYTFPLL